MSHSILLIQPSSPETRTYSDYESVNDCLEGKYLVMFLVFSLYSSVIITNSGVCRIYEEHLKRRNPNTVSKLQIIHYIKKLSNKSFAL